MQIMKKLSLILLASAVSFQFASAQFNGVAQSYVSDVHNASILGLSVAETTTTALHGQGGLTLAGNYLSYDSDSVSDRQFEGDRDTYSLGLGYVFKLDSVSLGATISFVDTETELDGTDTNGGTFDAQGDGIVLSLGAATEVGRFALSAVGGWGQMSTDAERPGFFPTERLTADYDTSYIFIEVGAIFDWVSEESYSLRPSAKLGYQSIEIDRFTEVSSEAGLSSEIAFNAIEDDVLYAEIGLLAEYYGFDRLVPFASLSVWHDLGDSEVELSSPDRASDDVPDLFETLFTGTVGFAFNVSENLNLGASASYFTGDELSGFNLGLSSTFSF
jgi:hypothetical protein